MTSSTSVNGSPVEMTMPIAAPPSRLRSAAAMATAPSKMHQNTRCGTGASTLPPAVIVSITSEPESDEVTKNTTTSTMPMNEVIVAKRQLLEHLEQLQLQRRILRRGVAIADHLVIAVPPKTTSTARRPASGSAARR